MEINSVHNEIFIFDLNKMYKIMNIHLSVVCWSSEGFAMFLLLKVLT